jgi:NAD(P)-dependent dehydrogenase (short-subunit alcohol dehydrogenase family)
VHQEIPWAGHATSAASKGGVMLLMRSIAQELAPHLGSITAGDVAHREPAFFHKISPEEPCASWAVDGEPREFRNYA